MYYVIGTGNGCTSNPVPVTAFVTPLPQAPVVKNDTICAGSAVVLRTTVPAGVTVNWYSVPSGGTPLITSANYTTPLLNASAVYYVEASSNGCISPRTAVTVTVEPLPQSPVVSGATICNGTATTLTVTPAAGATYEWFSSGSSTTVLATGNTYQTPVLTKTTTYYVQSMSGICESGRVPVTVTVVPVLVAPSAPGQIICSGSTATLKATAKFGSFQWYDAPAGGNLLSTNAVFTTPPLTSNTTYYVQTVYSACTGPGPRCW